ncbi:hypothetical protein EWM64_g10795, partial [Hericium alpestre]
MGDSNASTPEMVMMTPYLHFTGGDVLYFKSLQPSSHGAIAGACLVLVIFALLERMLSAARGVMQAHWRRSALALTADHTDRSAEDTEPLDDKERRKSPEVEVESSSENNKSIGERFIARRVPVIAPFVASHDIARGVLYALQALMAYVLMLAVISKSIAMRLTVAAVLAVFASVATAHFQMQFPVPRGPFVEDDEPTFCDNYVHAVSNRSEFPLSGGFFTLNSEHPQWTIGVTVSTQQDPTSF